MNRNVNWGGRLPNGRPTQDQASTEAEELIRKGMMLCQLAEAHVNPIDNLGGMLANQGLAHQNLADLAVEPVENLQTAIGLFVRARDSFVAGSSEVGRVLADEGVARQSLAKLGVEPGQYAAVCQDEPEQY